MKRRYFDDFKIIRNRCEIKKAGLIFITYDDFMMGTWFGNINIFDKHGNTIMHATIDQALEKHELRHYAEEFCKLYFKDRKEIKQ